jgi:hypothetical protein
MRKRLAVLGTALAVFVALALGAVPAASSGENGENGGQGRIVRWDLVQFVSGVVLSGGEDVSEDAATGDLITLTGSGHARPGAGRAFGGGTFVHEQATGPTVQGAYYVTDFVRWRRIREGSFAATGLIDGIGNPGGATSGVLRVRVRLVPEVGGQPGQGVNGVLIIFCRLPGATVGFAEGVRLKVPSLGLDFVQHETMAGFTLFHVIA